MLYFKQQVLAREGFLKIALVLLPPGAGNVAAGAEDRHIGSDALDMLDQFEDDGCHCKEDRKNPLQDVQVKQQTLALAQRLYDDNKDKVDQGTLAPIELVRAQAQVASARQDLANSEGFEQQQELVLKNTLSRRGTADVALRDAIKVVKGGKPALVDVVVQMR